MTAGGIERVCASERLALRGVVSDGMGFSPYRSEWGSRGHSQAVLDQGIGTGENVPSTPRTTTHKIPCRRDSSTRLASDEVVLNRLVS